MTTEPLPVRGLFETHLTVSDVDRSVAFYRDVAPLIRDGTFRCVRDTGESYQHPTGFQAVTIRAPAGDQVLVVWHRLGGQPRPFGLDLPAGKNWRVGRMLAAEPEPISCDGRRLAWRDVPAWSGGVLLLGPG